MANPANVDIRDVRRFWNANPLFSGESRFEPGTREFFDEFLTTTLHEYAGSVPATMTKDVTRGTSVLDVGCGIGFWVYQFCSRAGRVTACDLTDRAVQITRKLVGLYGFEADVREGNAEQLPFPDGSFDHVNCQGVIHHTPDPAACIREFHRVLRPGGTVCFSVYYRVLPLRSRVLFRLVTALSRPTIQLRGRGREAMLRVGSPEELVCFYDGAENPLGKAYSRRDIQEMIASQFAILEVRRFSFPRRVLPFRMPDFVHRVLSRTFGLMIAFRCKKLSLPGAA